MISLKGGHRKRNRDLFFGHQLQKVHDRLAFTRAGAFRNEVDVKRINAAEVTEAEHLTVGVGDKHLFNDIAFLHLRSALTRAAALLFTVFGERQALDVALTRERHNDVFVGDKIEGIEVRVA